MKRDKLIELVLKLQTSQTEMRKEIQERDKIMRSLKAKIERNLRADY